MPSHQVYSQAEQFYERTDTEIKNWDSFFLFKLSVLMWDLSSLKAPSFHICQVESDQYMVWGRDLCIFIFL